MSWFIKKTILTVSRTENLIPLLKQFFIEMDFNEILPENLANVAMYFYNDSCAPCEALRPKVQELFSSEFPKLPLVFINATQHPMLTADYQIFASPTLLVFFEGKEYVRESKYIAIDDLKQKVSRIYDMVFGDV